MINRTCFIVIGIMSNTKSVAKVLQSLGWDSQNNVPIAVPMNLDSSGLFNVSSWNVKLILAEIIPNYVSKQFPEDDPRSQIIKSVWDLSNHVTAEKALNNLKRFVHFFMKIIIFSIIIY